MVNKVFTVALKNGEYYYLPDFLPRVGFTELRLRAYVIGSGYYGGGFHIRNLNLKFQGVDLPLSNAVRISDSRSTCKVNGNIDCTMYTNASQYGGPYSLSALVGTGNYYTMTQNSNSIVGTEKIDIIFEFSEKIKIDYLSYEHWSSYPSACLTDFGLLFDGKELYRTPLDQRGVYKNKMEAIITEETDQRTKMTNKVFTIVRKDGKIYFKNGNKGMQFLHIAPITPYGSNTYWSFRNLKFYNKENVEMKVTSYKIVNDYKATFVLDGKINATVEAKATSVYGSTYNITCLFQDTIYGCLYTGYDKLDMDWRDQI